MTAASSPKHQNTAGVPEPSAEQQKVLDRIAAQRDRLRARRAA